MTVRWADDHPLPVSAGDQGAQSQTNGVQSRQRGGDGPHSTQTVSYGFREG